MVDFGDDYLYVKGPNGGFSTSVRETWKGKTRYELISETADGKQASMTIDCYRDGDSLVMEMNVDKAANPLLIKLSRIDKVEFDDLSADGNIIEITGNDIVAVLLEQLQNTIPDAAPAAEAAK